MRQTVLVIVYLLVFNLSFADNADSISIKSMEAKVEQLDNELKEVRRDQLNYRIEKDLLKETYSSNYERINLVITIVLALIGVLGYLGIKDVTSIKKEYSAELSRLRGLQNDLELKAKDFGETKIRYDKEITEITKQNEEQNRKIKTLELKEKISNLFKEKNYNTALEFCLVALNLAPDDLPLLMLKARIHSRMRNYGDSIKVYLRMLEIDPNHPAALVDLAEVYLFNNQMERSDSLVEEHKAAFAAHSSGKVLALFELLKLYRKKRTKELLAEAQNGIDTTDLEVKKRRMEGWDLTEAINFVYFDKESNERFILINYLIYLDGQLNGKELIERLDNVVLS